MAQGPENAAVETVIAEYASLGADPFLGELPEEASHWHEVLLTADAELSPTQLLTASWLGVELGFQAYDTFDLQKAARQHTKKRDQDKHALQYEAGTVTFGHAHMVVATDRLGRLIDNEDASDYIQAQSHLLFGAIPLIELIKIASNQRLAAEKHKRAYRLAQATAVNFMHDIVVTEEPTPNERSFTRALDMLTIGNSLLKNEIIILPGPPRWYEDQPEEQSRHLLLWDTRRKQYTGAAVAYETELPRVPNLLKRGVGEAEIFYEGVGLLRELHTAMVDPNHAVPRETSLGKCVIEVARGFSGISGRQVPPTLALPNLSHFIDGSGESLAVPELPVDLSPVEYPEINFGALDRATVFEWYGQQINGRPLTRQEGLSLDRVLSTYNRPAAYEQLTTTERVTLNRLRLECATALAKSLRPAAVEQLNRITPTLRPLQEVSLQTRDVVNLYETAMDELRLRVIGPSIRGEVAELTNEDIIGELAAMLQEMDSEKNSLRNKEATLHQFNNLIQGVLCSLLFMRFTGSQGVVALPALAREKGSASLPGWDINVWQKGEGDDNVILASRCKVRISEDKGADRPMRQGDIAVVPWSLIKRTASVGEITKSFTSIARDDERSRRSRSLHTKWGNSLGPVLDTALGLVS